MSVEEVRQALQNCEAKITDEIHKGTKRDTNKIKKLQVEHAELTKQFGSMPNTNRVIQEYTKNDVSVTSEGGTDTSITFHANSGTDIEAYCQKCKTKRVMVNPVIAPTKNGKNGAKGKCATCGTNTFTLVKN